MKKRVLAGVLLLLTGILSGCGGGTGASGPAETSSGSSGSSGSGTGTGEAKVELRVMWWGDQKRADLTNKVIELFEKKHPDIDVMGEFAPSSGYFDKLNTQLASGSAADVFFLGGNVVDYANKGVLLDLGPYVDKQLDLTDMDQSMIEYGTLNGKLVHVSAGANARGIIINKAVFERAGLPVPEDGWDWKRYAEISKQIHDKLGGEGVYGTYNFTVDGMDIALKQNGKQLYDMENGKLGFEENDVLPWFKYWEETTQNGGVVPPQLAVSNPLSDPSKSLIITGKVGMSLTASNQLVAHQALTEDPLTMVQLPRGPKGTGVVFESSQGLSGYAETKHPEEVAAFISFFVNDPEAAKILGNDRGVPVMAANREQLRQNASDVDEIVYDYTNRVSEAAAAEPFAVSYNPPGFAEYSKLAETTVQEIGFGRKSVEEAVKDFYSGTLKIFESNK